MSEKSKEVKRFTGIDRIRLGTILNRIQGIKIALIGDLCLDVYWKADMTISELSRETPHYPLPVVEERVSPGAGANVAANIASLSPEKLYIVGVMGDDWRGKILMDKFSEFPLMDVQGVIVSSERVTNAYCKPLRKGISALEYEDPRIDFSNYEALSGEDEDKLVNMLEEVVEKADIICVSDQFKYGCITPRVREKIIELGRRGAKVVVDSRYRIGLFTDLILKPNEVEGWRAVYGDDSSIGTVLEEQFSAAKILAGRNKSKVCMTLGSNGCVYADGNSIVHVPSYEIKPPLDICGAGDTFLSAFACALAAGANECEAIAFANIASYVTIKKIGTTGTASQREIQEQYDELFD